MTDADLITLAEREQARLTNEGDNAAAAIMRALVDRVRGTKAAPAHVPSKEDVAAIKKAITKGPYPSAPKEMWPTEYPKPVPIWYDAHNGRSPTVSTTVPERIVPRYPQAAE